MVVIPLSEKVSARELRALLSSVHWTHAQLAARIGMGRANVTRWANGEFDPVAAFHIAVRCLGWHPSPHSETKTTLEKKKPGRPLHRHPGFDLTKAVCPHPDCKRGNRQMRAERDPYNHAILGKVLPIFCDGTHAFKHPRVTLRLDRKGRLWDISKWPTRRKLALFERRRVQQALVMRDAPDHPERLLQAFARCTRSLDGRPGCGSLLKYHGHAQSSNAQRRRLHVFQCSSGGCRQQQWELRYFDASGKEVARTPVGGARRAKTVLPRNARLCPVCKTELAFQK